MDKIELQRQRLASARLEFASDLQRLNDTVQVKFEKAADSVAAVKDKLNMRKRFQDHFWTTATFCVGVGVLASRVVGRSRNRVALGSRQIDSISQKVVQNLPQAFRPTPQIRKNPLFTTSLLSTLANVALSIYQARRDAKENGARHSRHQTDATIH